MQVQRPDDETLTAMLELQRIKFMNEMLATLSEDEKKILLRQVIETWLNANVTRFENIAEDAFRKTVAQKTNDALVDWTPVLEENVKQMIDNRIASCIERGFHENQKWQTQKKKADEFMGMMSKQIETYLRENRWL